MRRKNGISLIVLIVTIIVMIIIAGSIIISLQRTNIIDRAKYAMEVSEQDGIEEAVIASTFIKPNGETDLQKTYDGAKEILAKEGLVVKGLDATTKTFTVEGKYGTYTVKLSDLGAEVTKNGSDGPTPTPGGDPTVGFSGTYALINYSSYTITITDDGNGNLTSNDITIMKDTTTGKYTTNSLGSEDNLEIYSIANNKILVISSSDRADVFTTNGLEGMTFTGAEGKKYVASNGNYLEFEESSSKVYVSEDDMTVNYFAIPATEYENKVIIEKFVYTVEKDSSGNVTKIIDKNNNEYILRVADEWKGEYTAVRTLFREYKVKLNMDGFGTCIVSTIESDGSYDGEPQVMPYAPNADGTISVAGGAIIARGHNLGNNKVITYGDDTEFETLTTNGLEGLSVKTELIGKTYTYTDEYNNVYKITFEESSYKEYQITGDSQDLVDENVHYISPTFESTEDKFVIKDSACTVVERDANGNITKFSVADYHGDDNAILELVTE